MHALIHRALTPQTIAYAWLVLTVALALALAVAQSAIASGASLSPAGLPAAHAALAGPFATPPAQGPGPRACRTAAPADDARTAASASDRSACAVSGTATPIPDVRAPLAAAPRSAADALAVLYGGGGPHGPPASPGTRTIPVAELFFGRDLIFDLTLSLRAGTLPPPASGALRASPSLMPTAGPRA